MSYVSEISSINPKHIWRLHESSVSSVADTGSSADELDYRAELGTVSTQKSGPLGGGQTSFSMGFGGAAAIILLSIVVSTSHVGTMNWWAKKAATGSGGGRCLSSTSAGSHTSFVTSRIQDDGSIRYTGRKNGSSNSLVTTETSAVDSTDWHMYSITADGTNYPKFYKDGVLETQEVTTQTGTVPNDMWYGDKTSDLLYPSIACRTSNASTPTGDSFFTGDLSELFITDNELGASTLLSLFNAAQTGEAAPLVKHQRRRGRRTFNAAAL